MDKNTLIVYYTWSNGNTRTIAEHMAQGLGADHCTNIELVRV